MSLVTGAVGTVVVRNTAAAVQAMSSWSEAMAPGSPARSAEGWWVDDQLALTQLLDDSSMPYQGRQCCRGRGEGCDQERRQEGTPEVM
jgi:hypothetical protein